jgi:hypothetical protein
MSSGLRATTRFHWRVLASRTTRQRSRRFRTRSEEGVDLEVEACVLLENTNPYDPEAVRVDVDGRTVGYLSRTDARAYRRALESVGVAEGLACKGRIRGGWDRGQRDRGHYGIYLDLALYGLRPRAD